MGSKRFPKGKGKTLDEVIAAETPPDSQPPIDFYTWFSNMRPRSPDPESEFDREMAARYASSDKRMEARAACEEGSIGGKKFPMRKFDEFYNNGNVDAHGWTWQQRLDYFQTTDQFTIPERPPPTPRYLAGRLVYE